MRVRLILRVSVLTPVLLYMAVMAVCYLLHAGDAARHIRVSFSFWGTLLVYRLFSFDRRAQVRFGRYLLFLFLLTALTSAAAVLTDSSAARAISNASQRPEAVARDYVLMRRNVSGIYLFQDLVIFAPISVLMLLQRRKPLMNGLILGFVFLAVIKASFTIPLFVLLVVCILTVVSQRRGVGLMLLAAGGFFLLAFPPDELFSALAGRHRQSLFQRSLRGAGPVPPAAQHPGRPADPAAMLSVFPALLRRPSAGDRAVVQLCRRRPGDRLSFGHSGRYGPLWAGCPGFLRRIPGEVLPDAQGAMGQDRTPGRSSHHYGRMGSPSAAEYRLPGGG